jgi:hypothetical protein
MVITATVMVLFVNVLTTFMDIARRKKALKGITSKQPIYRTPRQAEIH